MWIPRDYHWSIYALSAEGCVTVKSVCVCETALIRCNGGLTPTSWVSRFSGCHNSSCNIRGPTSAVCNMAARLTCPRWSGPLAPGARPAPGGPAGHEGEGRWRISLKTMLQEWNPARKMIFVLFVCMFHEKKNDMMYKKKNITNKTKFCFCFCFVFLKILHRCRTAC